MFGYPGEAVIGQSLLTLIDPEEVENLKDALADISRGQPSRRIEVVSRRAPETLFHADIALSGITDQDEQPREVVCSIRDITERRQMEIGLRDMLRKERELGELKSRLISMASHDFRTPLAVILSSTTLLQMQQRLKSSKMTDEQKAQHLLNIESSVGHMTQLLNDVLSLTVAESGHLEINPSTVDLRVLCEEILRDVSTTTGQNHIFAFSASGDCMTTSMDKKILRQVLTNLLSNAVKYSPEKSQIGFELACDGEWATFQIRDAGIGIPEADQERLFEPFHRAKNVGTRPGTGLGLAIVKRSVEAHGGQISFESQVGIGTTFVVRMPMLREG
jgi:PAS domain S-box-containing protein